MYVVLFRPAARGIAPPALRLGLSGSIDVLKLNGPYSVRGTGWVALQPLSAILYPVPRARQTAHKLLVGMGSVSQT